MSLLVCLADCLSAGLHQNYFHETWWKGGAWTNKTHEPTFFNTARHGETRHIGLGLRSVSALEHGGTRDTVRHGKTRHIGLGLRSVSALLLAIATLEWAVLSIVLQLKTDVTRPVVASLHS